MEVILVSFLLTIVGNPLVKRGGRGGRTFQKLSHLGGGGTKFFARKGG